MDQLGLGKLITSPQQRDAVHVAVLPATAGETLNQGERVRVECGTAFSDLHQGVGIVDPFLNQTVQPGQQFWVWLTPGSIQSLRHDWSHPTLDAPPTTPQEVMTKPLSGLPWRTPTVVALCETMRNSRNFDGLPILADALEDAGFDQIEILHQLRSLKNSRWRLENQLGLKLVTQLGSDEGQDAVDWIETFANNELDQTYSRLMDAADLWIEHEDYTYDNTETYKGADYTKWPTFWRHYETITGRKPKSEEDTFFTCSC